VADRAHAATLHRTKGVCLRSRQVVNALRQLGVDPGDCGSALAEYLSALRDDRRAPHVGPQPGDRVAQHHAVGLGIDQQLLLARLGPALVRGDEGLYPWAAVGMFASDHKSNTVMHDCAVVEVRPAPGGPASPSKSDPLRQCRDEDLF
jgi:hypothetical protein